VAVPVELTTGAENETYVLTISPESAELPWSAGIRIDPYFDNDGAAPAAHG
jgi:hypothetical protein